MARRIIKFILIAIAVGGAAVIGMVLLSEKPPARHAVPNPNGYDDFVKAGRLATPIPYTNDYRTMSREELTSVVSTNEEALKLVRSGLSHECRVPDDYSEDYFDRRLPDISNMTDLAQLLGAEGRLAELEGRTNDAIKVYLDGVRFAEECDRGGTLISKLVGVICEGTQLKALDVLVDAVDAPQARKVAKALEMVDASEPPFAEFVDEEKRFSHEVHGLRGQIMALRQRKELKQNMDRCQQKVDANTRHRRRVMVAFAARAYELEHGKRPQSLADLVPTYLKAIPKDPTTGANLVYSP